MKNLKDKFFKLIKSRQFWTILVLFIINGVEGVRDFAPEGWLPAINGILGILAVYFRAYPKQAF